MRNITPSANESLIDAAREDYTRRGDADATELIYRHLSYVNLAGPKMTRDEMNER